jgi:hypothetical protein
MSLFSENASIALNESLISLGVKSMKICAIIVNIIPSENCICIWRSIYSDKVILSFFKIFCIEIV